MTPDAKRSEKKLLIGHATIEWTVTLLLTTTTRASQSSAAAAAAAAAAGCGAGWSGFDAPWLLLMPVQKTT
jgi:hypothetical protein